LSLSLRFPEPIPITSAAFNAASCNGKSSVPDPFASFIDVMIVSAISCPRSRSFFGSPNGKWLYHSPMDDTFLLRTSVSAIAMGRRCMGASKLSK